MRAAPDAAAAERALLTPGARSAARLVARESFVLLQNRDGLLPLAPHVRRIALIGPFTTSLYDQLGPHDAVGLSDDAVSIKDGVTARARRSGVDVVHTDGCDSYCADDRGFPEAVSAATSADVIVAVVGEPRDLTGEGGSRAHLRLTGRQYDLLDALTAIGKPLVLVLVAGRPIELSPAMERTSAILMAWYPGTEGGNALADVLFGDAEPGGRLPHTWPRTIGQVPLHYDALPGERPTRHDDRYTLRYVDEDIRPQFPFGWGLSYSRFAYAGLELDDSKGDAVGVRVQLTNTGQRRAGEVVQIYIRDPVASRSRPLRQLKAFRKVVLEPGETRLIVFDLPIDQLGFHLPDGTYVVEPGRFDVWAGGSAAAELHSSFSLTETLKVVPGRNNP